MIPSILDQIQAFVELARDPEQQYRCRQADARKNMNQERLQLLHEYRDLLSRNSNIMAVLRAIPEDGSWINRRHVELAVPYLGIIDRYLSRLVIGKKIARQGRGKKAIYRRISGAILNGDC